MATCCFLVGGGGCFSMSARASASCRRISAALKVAFPVRYAVASVPVTPNAVSRVGELSMTYRCVMLMMLRTLIAFLLIIVELLREVLGELECMMTIVRTSRFRNDRVLVIFVELEHPRSLD